MIYSNYLHKFIDDYFKFMTFTAKPIVHNNQRRIMVVFENKPELIQRFRQLKGARWSRN